MHKIVSAAAAGASLSTKKQLTSKALLDAKEWTTSTINACSTAPAVTLSPYCHLLWAVATAACCTPLAFCMIRHSAELQLLLNNCKIVTNCIKAFAAERPPKVKTLSAMNLEQAAANKQHARCSHSAHWICQEFTLTLAP